jgi:HlyD family secretion protein
MSLRKPRHLGWILTGIVIVAIIAVALWPRPVSVEQVVVERRAFETSIDADGLIRAHHRFSVAMPMTGILERLDIEPGDSVSAGQIIAHVIPPDIDARQREQAQAHVRSLESGTAELDQQIAAISPLLDQARRRAERMERLGQAGAVAREQVENAVDAHTQLVHQAQALRERQRAIAYEIQAARSVLAARPGQRVAIRAPVSGVLLRRYEESERTIMAGTPIMEIGDASKMEVIVDVLSADAVRVVPGMTVHLDGWGGGTRLSAVVRRIEPAARTKVSSLGIEEQRVNVFADLTAWPPALGDGYRVEASIVTLHIDTATCVPLGALVRQADQWYVYVNDNGTARHRSVQLGPRNALVASVRRGLLAGERVLMHPPETLQDGDRIR